MTYCTDQVLYRSSTVQIKYCLLETKQNQDSKQNCSIFEQDRKVPINQLKFKGTVKNIIKSYQCPFIYRVAWSDSQQHHQNFI